MFIALLLNINLNSEKKLKTMRTIRRPLFIQSIVITKFFCCYKKCNIKNKYYRIEESYRICHKTHTRTHTLTQAHMHTSGGSSPLRIGGAKSGLAGVQSARVETRKALRAKARVAHRARKGASGVSPPENFLKTTCVLVHSSNRKTRIYFVLIH